MVGRYIVEDLIWYGDSNPPKEAILNWSFTGLSGYTREEALDTQQHREYIKGFPSRVVDTTPKT